MELVKRYEEKELSRKNKKGLATLSMIRDGVSIPLGEVKDFEIDYGSNTVADTMQLNTSSQEITINGGSLSQENREALLGISSLSGSVETIDNESMVSPGITATTLDVSYLNNNLYANSIQDAVNNISTVRNIPKYYGLEGPDGPPINGDMMIREDGRLVYYVNGNWLEVVGRP